MSIILVHFIILCVIWAIRLIASVWLNVHKYIPVLSLPYFHIAGQGPLWPGPHSWRAFGALSEKDLELQGKEGLQLIHLRPQQCLLCGTIACFSGNLLLYSSDLRTWGQVSHSQERVSAPNSQDVSQQSICTDNFDLGWLLSRRNLEPGKLGSYASNGAMKLCLAESHLTDI